MGLQVDQSQVVATDFFDWPIVRGVQENGYHTAVYLAESTVNQLVEKISQKQNFNRDHSVNLFHLKPNGMKIMIDDDVVERIPDGQAMTAEVSDLEVLDKLATDNSSVPAAVEVRLSF
ncbi:hypothetical protein N7520_002334 [Penicillium odoratum]|uniref:uncharacterized protein n=1 Tax=Penicillium odoratum TaxID=1167516 RepID=UPI002546807A|nr:uncharacterized protein N7520_002334 [Penicillium odoratum]KAJ5771805.1 hypothetical protein N7520_002334 [Penicillium odoratum]